MSYCNGYYNNQGAMHFFLFKKKGWRDNNVSFCCIFQKFHGFPLEDAHSWALLADATVSKFFFFFVRERASPRKTIFSSSFPNFLNMSGRFKRERVCVIVDGDWPGVLIFRLG